MLRGSFFRPTPVQVATQETKAVLADVAVASGSLSKLLNNIPRADDGDKTHHQMGLSSAMRDLIDASIATLDNLRDRVVEHLELAETLTEREVELSKKRNVW